MASFSVDYDILTASEGFKSKAYVPVCTQKSITNNNPVCKGKTVGDVIGKSGTTIGAGVDLGQMNEYDLNKLKLPPHLFFTLKPYLGVKGTKALELEELELMEIDARILSNKVKDSIITKIVNQYEKDSKRNFNDLSMNIQTAIADYFYQFGPSSMLKAPHKVLWEMIIKGEWQKAAEFLVTQKDYKKRRVVEANLILQSDEMKPSFKLP
jgi:hypothetical protein